MKRLFTLMLAAFVLAFVTPATIHSASAQTDAATTATDKAVSDTGAKKTKKHKKHKKHTAPANEQDKTIGSSGGKKHHDAGADSAAPAAGQ